MTQILVECAGCEGHRDGAHVAHLAGAAGDRDPCFGAAIIAMRHAQWAWVQGPGVVVRFFLCLIIFKAGAAYCAMLCIGQHTEVDASSALQASSSCPRQAKPIDYRHCACCSGTRGRM